MTLLSLAAKNVRHGARSYAAFFLSSSFAVWLFFMYALLLEHPQMSDETVPETFRVTLQFVRGVVVLFSVLFILYSHSAFLKVRQKELGLLTLLGLLPGQVARMVHLENLLIGTAAISTGVGVGALTAKLMFLLVGRVLGLSEPMAFHFSWLAVAVTFLVFLLMFAVISLLGRFTLRRLSLAELFRSAAKPMHPPRFSWWLVALCAALIGGAYGMALTMDTRTLEDRVWPMLLMGVAGTYLFYTQASAALLRWLRERRPLYWRSTNLVTLSQMAYKMKENAVILFMVTVLSTLVLVFFGVGYSAWLTSVEQAEAIHVVNIQLVGEPGGVSPARVDSLLAEHRIKVVGRASLPALSVTYRQETGPNSWTIESGAAIVPVSALNEWRSQVVGLGSVSVPSGSLLIFPRWETERLESASIELGFTPAGPEWTSAVSLPVVTAGYHRMLNGTREISRLLVVEDALFADLQQRYGDQHGTVLHGWKLADWKDSGGLLADLLPQVGHDRVTPDGRRFDRLTGTAIIHRELLDNAALMLFLFGFLGLLFFLAAGNMIYFKLFTDLTQERRQYQALQKVGLRTGEVTRIVSVQTLTLFFVPILVASAHAAIFVQMLGRFEELILWGPVFSVAGLYTLLQATYFLAARRSYVRAVTVR